MHKIYNKLINREMRKFIKSTKPFLLCYIFQKKKIFHCITEFLHSLFISSLHILCIHFLLSLSAKIQHFQHQLFTRVHTPIHSTLLHVYNLMLTMTYPMSDMPAAITLPPWSQLVDSECCCH